MLELAKTKKQTKLKKHNGLLKEISTNKILFLMLVPAFVYFIIFKYLPMVGVILAFKKYTYAGGIFGSPWSGFDNFRFLFISGIIYRITRNTVLYNLSFLSLGIILQVFCAVILSELSSKIFKKVTQSFMFLPYFVSFVLLSAFVYNVFNYEYGTMNSIIQSMGGEPVDIYSMPWVWKYILNVFYQWKNIGYGTVIFLAAITSIISEYYEAARIDGANIFQQIRLITIPLIVPTIVIVFLFNVGKILQGQFELFYQIVGNNGQLYEATDIIDTYVFRSLTRDFDIGMGTAVGFYQSLFGLLLILTVNYVVKKVQSEYALF